MMFETRYCIACFERKLQIMDLANSSIITANDLANTPKRSRHPRARETLARYYRQKGRLLSIRRGLYAVVPEGVDAKTFRVDPFLVTARLTPDAVLAYHTALDFHGKAYSTFNEFYALSKQKARAFRFQSQSFRVVNFPVALVRDHAEEFSVQQIERAGLTVRVTPLERTFVDVLHRPDLAGGWEEVWRSLESIEFLDVEKVVHYAKLLRSSRVCAAVGFYLEQHRETLMIEDASLDPLRKQRPKAPQYLDPGARRGGKLVSGWNLLVPTQVLERSWEEPRAD
jgi:predicted transcriptional regulator of viral defense system